MKNNSPRGLSPRMRELVQTVARLTETRGYPPSIVECARELQVHPSRAGELAQAAKARGALLIDPRTPRSMRVPAKPKHSRRS